MDELQVPDSQARSSSAGNELEPLEEGQRFARGRLKTEVTSGTVKGRPSDRKEKVRKQEFSHNFFSWTPNRGLFSIQYLLLLTHFFAVILCPYSQLVVNWRFPYVLFWCCESHGTFACPSAEVGMAEIACVRERQPGRPCELYW